MPAVRGIAVVEEPGSRAARNGTGAKTKDKNKNGVGGGGKAESR